MFILDYIFYSKTMAAHPTFQKQGYEEPSKKTGVLFYSFTLINISPSQNCGSRTHTEVTACGKMPNLLIIRPLMTDILLFHKVISPVLLSLTWPKAELAQNTV